MPTLLLPSQKFRWSASALAVLRPPHRSLSCRFWRALFFLLVCGIRVFVFLASGQAGCDHQGLGRGLGVYPFGSKSSDRYFARSSPRVDARSKWVQVLFGALAFRIFA
jgi:hypothetical protein